MVFTKSTDAKDSSSDDNGQEEEIALELEKLESDEQDNEENGFRVDDDEKASWCLRKIRELKNKQSDHERLAERLISELQKEIQEIKHWRDKENDKIQNNIDFLETKLENYMHYLREDNPDLKTKNLPYGKLKFRAQRPKWKYDEERLLEFLQDNKPDMVRVKKKPDKRNLKKVAAVSNGKAVLPDSGQIVEGVTVVDRPEKFKVNVD